MRVLRAFCGFLLFFELPIPVYWLILHPFNRFWRSRASAGLWIAAASAWTIGGALLWTFRGALLIQRARPWPLIAVGLALIAVEFYLFWRVEKELGGRRLIGQAELTGSGELFTGGLYTRVRHPRYAGMFAAILGVAMIAGTPTLWAILVPWWLFALWIIHLEERELAARFGPAYSTYRERVPAFLPFL